MTTAQELTQRIAEAAKNSPYVVTPTEDGFVVSLNIIDEKWIVLLNTGQIKKSFTITAKLNESNQSATLNDTLYELEWSTGLNGILTPRLGGKINTQQGEINKMEFGVVLGTPATSDQAVGATAYSFSTPEAKRWLQKLLDDNGWKKKLSVQTMIGIIVASSLVVIGIIAAVLVLTGVLRN